MTTEAIPSIETEAEAVKSGTTRVELWHRKIKLAKDEDKDWREQANKAIEIYEGDDSKTRFNILHSNIETLVPALYNSSPIPDVRRRYGDADPVAKMVVDMTERALTFSIDQYDFDRVMIACIKDACLPGRGVARVRYEPEFNDQPHPETQEMVEVKSDELVTTERVCWDDVIIGPGSNWDEVPWIAFEHDLTRDELVKLNPMIGKTISVNADDDSDKGEEENEVSEKGIFNTACVYEIWDKASKSVIFIARDEKEKPLKVEPDPLGLEGFFPCPPPIQQISRVSSMVPVCPYTVYQPLIEELDSITGRIRSLVSQLKVRGLVDAAMAKDLEALRTAGDGQYLTATDATGFTTGGGGLEKGIAHMPMDPTVKALQQLYVQREQIKQTIYEVTGLSDILRGASKEAETATAQNLKAQWGSLRIQQLQGSIARFARDLFRLKVEIMAKHFDPQKLLEMTNLPDQNKPEQMQLVGPAIQMFKSEGRNFRVDIETDSTIRADMQRSQEQMNLFLAGTGQFATAMTGVVQLAPEMLPVITEVYTSFARKFKLGKQAEDALDGLSKMAPQMAAKASQNAAKDPEAEKLKLEQAKMQQSVQADQQKMQLEQQKAQMSMQVEQAKLGIMRETKTMEMQFKQQESELSLRTEREKAQLTMRLEQMKFDHQMQLENTKFDGEQRRAEAEHTNSMAIAQDQAAQKAELAKQQPKANGAH